MNCHYCGAPLNDNEIFCLHCGTRQAAQPEEVPVAEAEEEAPEVIVAEHEPVAAEEDFAE